MTTTSVALVDAARPTVSRGRTISASRRLTTVVWAPDVAGRWPLVVFAPGFSVGPDTYAHLCRAWAAAGYVVAAPEFPLADPAVAGPALDERDIDNEPADIRFVITSLSGPSTPFGDQVDATRVAVAGHSDGAEVALAVAQQGDRAIRAVIALSGQPVTPHVAPNPPLLAVHGDADEVNAPGRGQAVFDQATSPRFLLVLSGAGHLPPFGGGTRWQPIVEEVSVDFLDRYAAGTTDSSARLVAAGNHPGLSRIESAP